MQSAFQALLKRLRATSSNALHRDISDGGSLTWDIDSVVTIIELMKGGCVAPLLIFRLNDHFNKTRVSLSLLLAAKADSHPNKIIPFHHHRRCPYRVFPSTFACLQMRVLYYA